VPESEPLPPVEPPVVAEAGCLLPFLRPLGVTIDSESVRFLPCASVYTFLIAAESL